MELNDYGKLKRFNFISSYKDKLIICLTFCLIFSIGKGYGASFGNAKAVRYLSDYKRVDGTFPDGTNKNHDDTSALKAALAEGPGIVKVGPGFFRFGNVTIPEKVVIVGTGLSTVVRSNGEKIIFCQKNVSEWGLKDLVLDGETEAKPLAVPNNGKQGLVVSKSHAFSLCDIKACRFEGIAVEFSYTDLKSAEFCDGGTVSRLTLCYNYAGLSFSKRAEYITATQIKSYKNTYGCIINGGNNNIGNSHFCSNICGVLIEDMANGSHGSVNSCLINHNYRHAILARKVQNGFNVVGCNIFYGIVELIDCKGIKISSSTLGRIALIVKGNYMNLISGNYIVPGSLKKNNISKQTILKNNFTDKEIWTSSKQEEKL
jgi:hypothetical protein